MLIHACDLVDHDNGQVTSSTLAGLGMVCPLPSYYLFILVTGMISCDNMQLLCELLEEIGRRDLSERVKIYVYRKNSECIFAVVCVRVSILQPKRACKHE